MEKNKLNHEGLLALEQPLIKVSLEQLKKSYRNSHKQVERDANWLVNQVETKKDTEQMIQRLENLKKRLSETRAEEEVQMSKTKARIEHLSELVSISQAETPEHRRWSKTRLDRVLVDYLLRRGYFESAKMLSEDSSLEKLVDIDVFQESQRVVSALQSRSCTEALQWCAENRSSLKKAKSSIEFDLRFQEYVELVRERKLGDAIVYVKKFLSPWSESHLKEIQQAMGLLAFGPDTECLQYKKLYDMERWKKLVLQFQQEHFALHCLTKHSGLQMTLEAGLSALKTPHCSEEDEKNVNCPVCDEASFGSVAEKLPLAHHVNSCLVCRITGKMMDANNPPMVLPNGYVYSQEAVDEMIKMDGFITCPRTGAIYQKHEIRKAFIS